MTIQLSGKPILPTPAGAYYCISSRQTEPVKQFLQRLMTSNETLHLDAETVKFLSGGNAEEQESLLLQMQKLKWLQELDDSRQISGSAIEDFFPDFLKLLSSDAKTLLAGDQGLCLSSTGFTHEAAEEVSALSGDLSSLYSRHQGIIRRNLNINSSAFALVDASGYSQLGFWPLYIGDLQFMLVISGVPRFDQDAFVNLIWALHKRYYIEKPSEVSDAA